MAFDILVRSLFTDSGAGAGLAKLNSQIHDVAKAAPGGQRGLYAFESGLRTLALEAVGIQGPIGRVAEGLLKFGGGSALVLGAAAGIGIIAEAYKLAAREGNELADANEKAAETWRNMVAKGKPLVALQNELTKAIKDRTDAEEELARLSVESSEGTKKGTSGEIAQAEALISQRENIVSGLREQLRRAAIDVEATAAQAGVKFATRLVEGVKFLDPGSQIATLLAATPQWEAAGKEAGQIVGKQLVLAMERELENAAATGNFAGRGGRFGIRSLTIPTSPGLKRFITGDKGAGDELTGKPNFNDDKIAAREFFFDPLKDLVKEGGKLAPQKADVARIAAETVAVVGALSQGGAGGILSATGGLLSSIKGIPSPIGAGLTALGGFVSLFDSGQERRQREMMEELRRIRQNTDHRGRPDRTSITIMLNGKEVSGALVDDVIYQINRMSRRDATPRLPSS